MSVPQRLRALTGGAEETVEPTPEPVTVTVARVVRPDRRAAFERAAAAVLAEAANFPGNLGASLLRPGPGSYEYHLVYRFADDESLAEWERSPQRRDFLARLPGMVEDERYARVTGLEGFFPGPAPQGPAWRSWLLTVLVVLAFTSSFQVVAMPLIEDWPWPARLLLSAVFVVSALRLVMPPLTRLLAGWLRPRGN